MTGATADSRARPGDRIQVRRDGVERVAKDIKVIDAASGSARIERRQVPLFVGQLCIPKEGLVYVFPLQLGCQIVTATIPTIRMKPDFNELASKVF